MKPRVFHRSMLALCLIITGIMTAFLPGGLGSVRAQDAVAGKNVLFISSYSYDWPSVPKQIRGVEDRIDGSANIQYLFMDTKHLSTADAEAILTRQLETVMAGTSFDLVILGDDAALDYALKERDRFFAGKPLVFEGINDADKAYQAAKDPYITGVVEAIHIAQTIATAQKLQPQAKRVVGILDDTVTGQGTKAQYLSAASQFGDLSFEVLDTSVLSREDIQDQVASYGSDTILLYLIFNEDGSGTHYAYNDAVQVIFEAARTPIYKADETGIGNGIFGGCVISYEDMGAAAADMAARILEGASPGDIAPQTMPTRNLFDAALLNRYGLSKADMPEDSQYVNDTPDFFSRYKDVLIPSIVIGVLMLGFILYLVVSILRHKAVQRKLSQRDAELLIAIRQSGMEFWIYDPQTHVADLNDVATDVKDTLKANVLPNYPQCVFDNGFVHPLDQQVFKDMCDAVDAGEESARCEARIMRRGSYQWEQIRMIAADLDGRSAAGRRIIIGSSMSIVRQKEEESRFNNYMEAVLPKESNAIATFRLNLTANRVMDAKSRYPAVLAKQGDGTVDDFFRGILEAMDTEEDRQKNAGIFDRQQLLTACQTGRTEIECTYRTHLGAGDIRWVRVFLRLSENPVSGEIEGVIYSQDIHKQTVMSAIIDESVNHDYDFLAFIDGRTEALFFYFQQDSVAASMLAEAKAEGRTFSEVAELTRTRYVVPEEQETMRKAITLPVILEHLEKGGDYNIFFNIRLPGGSLARKKQRYSYIDRKNRYILLSETDITDLFERERRTNEELKEALAIAHEATEAKTTFFSGINHDMRTPLNGIIGFTDFALQASTAQEKQEYLEKIRDSGSLLLNLINNTLEISRMESGKVSLKPSRVNARKLYDSVNLVIYERARAQDVRYVVEMDAAFDDYYLVDGLKFQEVLLNLLSNAVKYTPAGGHVWFRAASDPDAADGRNLVLTVRDDGIGISKEFLPTIFEPFTQEHTLSQSSVVGTGLGLSIVKHIVTLMEGDIAIESEKGAGTCITVRLPMPVEKGALTRDGEAADDQTDLKGRMILLCEDNVINIEIARKLLTDRGMQVICAETGAQGVELFTDSKPGFFDAVLMDIHMPEMNGYEATRRIRAAGRPDAQTIPILAMTADAYDEDVQKCFKAGMNGHLSKPVDARQLFGALRKWCGAAEDRDARPGDEGEGRW